jgi:hypothetical protein
MVSVVVELCLITTCYILVIQATLLEGFFNSLERKNIFPGVCSIFLDHRLHNCNEKPPGDTFR